MNFQTKSTIVALVLLPLLGASQKQIGNTIKTSNVFTDYKMSSDGKLIVVYDIPNIRTFEYNNIDWEEKNPIASKNWVHFEISKNGKTFVGSTIINFMTGETKALVYDLNGNDWVLRPDIDAIIYPQRTATLGGHEFIISQDGINLAILNHSDWTNSRTYLNIWKFENNVWTKEFETIIENCREPNGEFDKMSNTLLINGIKTNNKQYSTIFLKENSWQNSQIFSIDHDYLGAIKLDGEGKILNCIFNLTQNNSSNTKVIVKKYHIKNGKFEVLFRQELPSWLAYSSDFSRDGNCFVTGYDPISDFNKVRIFKLKDDTYIELSTGFVSNDSDQYYGYDVQLSDDCKTISFGITPKFLPFSTQPQIKVYDISDLISTISDVKDNSQINIFPNPTSGLIHVKGKLASGKSHALHFYNSIGQPIDHISIPSDTDDVAYRFDIKGLYYYTLMSDGIVKKSGKLIVL